MESVLVNSTSMSNMESGVNSKIGTLSSLTTTNKSNMVAAVNENVASILSLNQNLSGFGKLLWSGNFTTGSITVPGLSNYAGIAVLLSDQVLCYGSRNYGSCAIMAYGGYTHSTTYLYRLVGSGDTLTIDGNAMGGSNGTEQKTILGIYGIFRVSLS